MILIATILLAAPFMQSADDLLEYDYSWSKEAAAVPALDRRFRADAVKQKKEALETAREDREARRQTGLQAWNPHSFSRSWTTAGQSARLLSLEGGTGAYTGGAHPNSGTTALLWDRKLARELKIADLLRPGQSWTAALRQPFCTLLDRERRKKREEPITRGEWPNQCPELKEVTVTLADRDDNGRFDHVDITADDYVAGPYAEGPYEISLPLTATMLTRLKPEYRPSFEPHPPVQ